MTTETHKMPELLPCPYCGSRAELRQVPYVDGDDNSGGYYIECTNGVCGISTQLRFSCGDDARPLLAETWNRRASPSPPADVVVVPRDLFESMRDDQIRYLGAKVMRGLTDGNDELQARIEQADAILAGRGETK